MVLVFLIDGCRLLFRGVRGVSWFGFSLAGMLASSQRCGGVWSPGGVLIVVGVLSGRTFWI